MTRLLLLLSAAIPSLAAAQIGSGQVAGAPDPAADPVADAIIVTATRTPTPIDQVPSAVTVLTKSAIDRLGDIDVSTLLTRTPGVAIARNGGFGTATSLFVRGANGDQTVVVLDGVKLTDPAATDGSFNLGNLLTDDASRIEVLRGPQSTLWGSQAIGGVVNIVTPLATRPLEGSVDLEGGSRQTADARAAIGGHDGRVTWRLAGETFTTDGISALAPRFGGHERDGYTNQSAQGRVVVAITDDVSADLRGFYSKGHTDQDGYDPVTFANADTPEYESNRQLLGYAGLNAALFDGRLKNRVGFSYTDTRRNDYDPRLAPGDEVTFHSNGSTRRIEYEGTLAIADGWTAVFGVEHERSRFRSISPQYATVPDGGDATLTDEYLQVNGTLPAGLTLTGGVRHDDYTSYGGRFLFTGGAAWALPTGTVIRARYGEGFKAPSLYQLYSEYGNPDLDATRSHGWEASVEQSLLAKRVTVGADYFQRRTRNEVVFESCDYPTSPDPLCVRPGTAEPRFGYYQNLARTKADGVEVTGQARPVDRLTLDGNWSWTLSDDRDTGLRLPRRPRTLANGSASLRWPREIVTTVAVRHAGHSFDDAANTVRLAGYTLLDLRLDVPVAKGVSVFVRGDNVTDKRYETAYLFNALGRSVYAGVRGRF